MSMMGLFVGLSFTTGPEVIILTTDIAYTLGVGVSLGSGRRLICVSFGPLAKEATHTALTWVAINTRTLGMMMRGGRGGLPAMPNGSWVG